MTPTEDILHVVTFRHKQDNKPRPICVSWHQLCEQLTKHQARPGKDGRLWSPTSYKEGTLRGKENVEAVYCFVGDVDGGTAPAALSARWQGLAYCFHSTHSSAPDKLKWRIIFQLKYPIPADQWPAVHRKLTIALLGDHADPACKDASRIYYLPACPPDLLPYAFADVQEGAALDPDDYPEPEPEVVASAQMKQAFRERPQIVGETSGKGENRPGDDYNRRGPVLDLLQGEGWQNVGESGGLVRLRRPNKSRDWSATFNYQDSRVFYCFSSSAAPFEVNTGYSPFGVYAMLEAGGDFAEAARRLGREGYGDQTPVSVRRAVQEAEQVAQEEAEATAPEESNTPPSFRKSDTGNAARFVHQHGDTLRFDHAMKCFYVWNGKRWEYDRKGRAQELAKETVRTMYAEAAGAETEEERAAIAMHAKNSDKHPRIMAMLELAKSDPRIAVTHEEWDADKWLLNVENGTINLRTGTLGPHQRADLITKLAPVVFAPDAKAPTWEAALLTWQPLPEVREFLQRAAGYSLTGQIGEECAFFSHGPGRNGKSKLIGALESVMGDYATRVSIEVLMDSRKAGNATPELIPLIGARIVIASEVQEGRRLNESFIKDATGGDRITARAMYAGIVEFLPQFKLWMYGNHKPIIRGTDDGIWSRLPLIPFTVTIPEKERDPGLSAKLDDERAGILAWMVRGCLAWQRERLSPPKAVIKASAAYRKEMDVLGSFFDDCCEFEPGAWTKTADLRAAYENWAEEIGEKRLLTPNQFAERLTQRGCSVKPKKVDGKTCRGWEGVSLPVGGKEPPPTADEDTEDLI